MPEKPTASLKTATVDNELRNSNSKQHKYLAIQTSTRRLILHV